MRILLINFSRKKHFLRIFNFQICDMFNEETGPWLCYNTIYLVGDTFCLRITKFGSFILSSISYETNDKKVPTKS